MDSCDYDDYELTDLPTEQQINDWNIHNDHADDELHYPWDEEEFEDE